MLRNAILAALVLGGGFAVPLVPASATPTLLTLENPGLTTYQQQLNSPCVIGESSCKNPVGFGLGEIPNGDPPSYDVSSTSNTTPGGTPLYTVGQITATINGTAFFVGIDVNTTTHPLATEQLDFFGMYVDGNLVAVYDPTSPGTQLFTNNNGNGRSDELLKGFDLTSFQSGQTVYFRAIVNNATDGKEQFFLVNTSTPPVNTPEPTSLLILGTVLVGAGVLCKRKSPTV